MIGNPAGAKGSRAFLVLYFLFGLLLISLGFATAFLGIQGDGAYYYSLTVSILWDGDLDLKNQFDGPDPLAPGQTLTRGLYAVDERTGRAFSSFNPGTGLLMLPGAVAGRVANALTGNHHPDPFDLFHQRYAAFMAVILSSLTLVLLFLLLRRFVSFGVAASLPFLCLFATNWLFYATAFAAWSHVYALFLCALLAWSFLRAMERPALGSALLFGLAGGFFFSTRNYSILLSLPLFVLWTLRASRTDSGRGPWLRIAPPASAALSFLLGAAPQLALNAFLHGSPFRTGAGIVGTGAAAFGLPQGVAAKVFDPKNLEFLYSNLFNSDNGLFTSHAFYLAGLIGALLWTQRDRDRRRLVNVLFAGVFILWFVDAGYWDNWFNRAAGSGFGQRRFLDVLPFFLLGAANLLEWSRSRRFWRPAMMLLFSLFAAAGVSLTYFFQADYSSYFAVRDAFAELYRFLLVRGAVLGFAAALFLLLWFLVRPGDRKSRPIGRSPLVLGGLAVLTVVPALIFRPDAAAQRARFQAKRGFFLLSSRTPFVGLSGRSWGVPVDMARAMLNPISTIELPAPLEAGDILLLSYSVDPRDADSGGFLEVFLGGKPIGRAPLKAGRQVGQFGPPPDDRPRRDLTLKLGGNPGPRHRLHFHEGRVVFREMSGRPFGHVDTPPDSSIFAKGTAVLTGWTLADKGVAGVYAVPDRERERGPAPEKEGPEFKAEASFGESARADIERTYVLYPGIQRAVWRIILDRKSLPKEGDRQTRLKIVSVGNDGQETILGLRRIIWRD